MPKKLGSGEIINLGTGTSISVGNYYADYKNLTSVNFIVTTTSTFARINKVGYSGNLGDFTISKPTVTYTPSTGILTIGNTSQSKTISNGVGNADIITLSVLTYLVV